MMSMSELSNVQNSEKARETKSRVWHTAGNIALGAALTVGTAGVAVAVHSIHELRTMQVSVDPLELDRSISTDKSAYVDTTPMPTDIPSPDEAPRENRFLDGLPITG